MNKDLVDEFFERDLSDEELVDLKKSLDEDSALLFSEKAQVLHRSLSAGSAKPWTVGSILGGRLLVARSLALALGVALLAGVGARSYQALQAPPVFVMNPAPTQASSQPGKQLVIRLNLEQAAMVETVVRNAGGTQICSLGTMAVDAGAHRLVWNGKTPNCNALTTGRYQVVTRWGGKEIVRWVEFQAPATGA
jgi:hypothetical protein